MSACASGHSTPKAATAKTTGRPSRATQVDPVEFAKTVLGFHPWPRQAEWMRAAASSDVVVASGHRTGKTTGLAHLALWWEALSKRVIVTAPTNRQIDALLAARGRPGGEVVGVPAERDCFEGLLRLEDVVLVDEPAGVSDEVLDVILGMGCRVVLAGVPLTPPIETMPRSHRFRDLFELPGNERRFRRFSICSEEAAEQGIPGLAKKSWVDEKRREWGDGSPLWDVRVAGRFCQSSSTP